MKLLIVADVDSLSAGMISEKYVCGDNREEKAFYDACIICGPFIHHSIDSKEDESTAIADMASIIAQFENIVCRVIYLSSDSDPTRSLSEQLSLTPNSVNIHARSLPLLDGLYLSGFTEKDSMLSVYSSGEDSDDETDGYEIQTSTSAKIIQEVLTNAPAYAFPEATSSFPPNGIFLLNYKYSHTLNNFLFFQNDLLQSVRVKLAIIPVPQPSPQTSSSTNESPKTDVIVLPRQLRGLTIVSPPSLRLQGGYSVVTLTQFADRWEVSEVLDCNLEASEAS
jgi:hypothetical protein